MILLAAILVVLTLWVIGFMFTLGFAADQVHEGKVMTTGQIATFVLSALVAWPWVLGAAISERVGLLTRRL